MSDAALNEPVRKLQLKFTQPPSTSARLHLPCLGLDFGSAFVRLALLRNSESVDHTHAHSVSDYCHCLLVDLMTYTSAALPAALQYAKEQCDAMTDLKVYYTGHQHQQLHQQLQQAFPNAVSITRREKLQCHNNGAHFLVDSKLPDDDLYHDTKEAEETKNVLMKTMEGFIPFLPPKMVEVFQSFVTRAQAYGDKKFPLTLSIVGSNNIFCSLQQDGTFVLLDARCSGPRSSEAMWKLIKPQEHSGDFAHFLELAEKGDRCKVDSLTSEIADAIGFYGSMPADYPIFDFGKMEKLAKSEVALEDLARGILAFNTDLIMCKTVDFATTCNSFPIYFTGSLVQHKFVRSDLLIRIYMYIFPGMPIPKFFKTDATAALGACIEY